jgi:hypothetical protein
MAASTFLIAGLGSVMFIGRQIAFTPSSAGRQVDAAKVIGDLAADLREATVIAQQSTSVLEFVVADRDNDGVGERFRYEWSGTSGAPLTRRVNNGTAQTVLGSVQEFQISAATETKSTTFTTTATSAEALLASNTSIGGGNPRGITTTDFSAQQVNPSTFSGVPANATGWNATRVDFYGQKYGTFTGTLLVQLRSAGDPNNGPTSQVLGQLSIPENNLTGGFNWNQATFASPITGLALHRRYAIGFVGLGGAGSPNDAQLYANDQSSGGVLESSDAGASWQYVTGRQIYYRLYGTYSSPGTSYPISRNYVSSLRIGLRAGSTALARIDTRIPLNNRPELLARHWRLDFDRSPTTVDYDGDGTIDWATTGGSAFATNTLANGVWQPAVALETRPLNDFTGITTVNVCCRNTSVGGNGAVIQIHADRQGGTHAPILCYVQLQSDGTQTLTLYGKSSDATSVQLFKRERLPNEFLRVQLTILPASNVVNLQINDVDQGAFVYSTYAPSTSDRFLKIYADTSAAEFDYVDLRVATP